ncbi:T9SS type A sorting domain-containing protein [Dyadobacter sp. CY343]|uniref:T9SS type A sorting domain-containing protein n=1 Tax=Dyadobacter sp. CY343 TaxID=2907299 RepID=UPI001F22F2BF|nr:T9SS type A sorting domain-containing protein [Dyadobacter sp. CY343]MCE7062486.1 T9SS C-terminal target domain-containing protein [Dyadobacter sp. CY343]
MKAIFLSKLTFSLLLISAVTVGTASAQSDKTTKSEKKERKSQIHIRVTEEEDGKTKDIEKSYEVGAMTSEERDKFVEKVLDSLGVDKKKKQTISITMDDGDTDVLIAKKRRKAIIDHRDDREPLAFHWDNDFSYDFNFDTEKLRNNMRSFEREMRPKAKVFMRDMEDFGKNLGEVWEKEVMKPASVRSLNVYANNPDNGMLNLRFSVPEKGDVNITVTDTKGKEVGSKSIKDFEGEFVGQIELKKNTKGTLFVTVVQNEDGTVKRIVVP